jgi:uncharacterized membrane protein YedE/YeeE
MSWEIPALTLAAGTLVGIVWQKSKACSVSGYRDFYLFRDTYLLKTVAGLFVGAFGGFLELYWFSPYMSTFFSSSRNVLPLPTIALTLIGGIGFGFFSVLAGGCPTKQHVSAASGGKTSMLYLLGFYGGLLYFHLVILQYIIGLLGPLY